MTSGGVRLSPFEVFRGWCSLVLLMIMIGVLALVRGRSRRGVGGGWRRLQADPEALHAALEASALEEEPSR